MSLATEDKSCPVEGIGTLRFRVKYKGSFHEITLTDVLFNPKLRRNLLSGSRLESKGAHFVGTKGRKPSVLHLKPFGCLAYAGVPKQIRKKFDMRAKMGIMMGYAQRTKGYRIWLIDENKLVETINGFSDLSEQQETLMVEVTIPNCYKQAIRSRDASKWHDAMDKEIKVMKERKVWDLVDHPDNIKILENRWVYTIKYDENNKIVRYKARLVARGNTQLRGESFDEDLKHTSQLVDQQQIQIVEWAKHIPHFNELPLHDRATLLKAGWNEILIAAFCHKSVGFKDGIVFANGRIVNRLNAINQGVGGIYDRLLQELVSKMRELRVDRAELGCLKAIILFNPEAKNLKAVQEVSNLRDKVYTVLEEYCRQKNSNESSRFSKLLLRLPALRSMGLKCTELLFFRKFIDNPEPIDKFLVAMLETPNDP
ncbi:retinoic acid receptor RXR-alpha [Trichonephila clavipes]|nr:retinoic acid receptor RXR-alpha [Trichonephila clavipes]